MVGWIVCIVLALTLFAMTARWISRDYKKSKIQLAPLSTPTCDARLDEAETLLNVKMAELTDLHEQSLKGIKFDPKTYVPPPQNPLEAKDEELRKMTEQRKPPLPR